MEKRTFKSNLISNNPVFVLYLGVCAVLGVTTSLDNAVGISLIMIDVIVCSSVVIALIRKFIPTEIRIPVYMVIVAATVTFAEMMAMAYIPEVHSSLGIFVALLAVSGLVLNTSLENELSVKDTFVQSIGISLGASIAVFLMAIVRSLLATGGWMLTNLNGSVIFDLKIIPQEFTIGLFAQPLGAFVTFGILAAIFAAISNKNTKEEVKEEQ